MINVMGLLREVQGKQLAKWTGKAVLMLACVSVLALSGGCSRAVGTNVTTMNSAPASTIFATSSTTPLTLETTTDTSAAAIAAVTADTAANTGTAAASGAAAPAASAPPAPAPVLYESIAFGVRVSETGGWVIQKSFDTPSLKVVFAYEKIQAILSVLSPDKTGKAILGELLQGLGDVEVLARTETSLEVRTRHADSMRTIAYVEREGRFNYLLVFVTPENGLDQRLDNMESLISSLDYLG